MKPRPLSALVHPKDIPLWQEWFDARRPETLEALLTRYEFLVGRSARHVAQGVWRVSMGDLKQEGRLGLLKAIQRFSPTWGVLFRGYAVSYIRFGLREFLRQEDWAPRQERQKERLGLSLPLEVLSLDHLLGDLGDEEEDMTPVRALIADSALSPEEIASRQSVARAVRQSVYQLPERERYIVAEMFEGERSQAAIAREMSLSHSRVQQLWQQGKRRLLRNLEGLHV